MYRISYFVLIGMVISAFILPNFFVAFFTPSHISGDFIAQAQSSSGGDVNEERDTLEKELAELEKQISGIENDITKTQNEKDNLNNQIYVLRSKIRKLNLQIDQSNLIIGDLRFQITDTSESIDQTAREVEKAKGQIGDVLQHIYEEDQKTKIEIILVSSTLSDFFNNVVSLEVLSSRLRELLQNMEDLNIDLQIQRGALANEKVDEENFVKIQLLQKQQSQNVKVETEQLLVETKGKENEYQKLLADTQKKAQEIRSRIFELIGVPDAPTFGEAVEIANIASAQTGVRPALLLAVLTQESNLGKNVGQCYLKDAQTGDGVSVRGTIFKQVMKPTRDVQPFLRITKALGRDPFNTPVSCPIPSIGGYGGAMGPAQFIPSTWAGYENKLEGLLGRPGDPWNIKDAFLASALYLADGGATKQTYDAEWCAAQRYFSGRCSTRYRFYGDSVMALAAKYEKDIRTLEEAG